MVRSRMYRRKRKQARKKERQVGLRQKRKENPGIRAEGKQAILDSASNAQTIPIEINIDYRDIEYLVLTD